MSRISIPEEIDLKLFDPERKNLETKYGLPKEVKFCKRCVISNQRPNSAIEYQHTEKTKKDTIYFNEEGICDACRFAIKKQSVISWDDREKQLQELCDRFRSKGGSYDCILPGSGGKDSFYASHILKNKYGMHPLTVTWAPHIYTDWGYRNFQAWIHAGLDNYCMTPNGRVHRLLTRLSLEKLLHPFQAFMLGQKALAPKMAILFNIPLVFYGENEAEYGNPISGTETAIRDWSYFTAEDKNKIYLGGVSVSELIESFGLTNHDLLPYFPADPDEIKKKKIEVHYLGYYLKWHPQSCYYYAVEHGGFQASPERTSGTYSKYNSIDDKIDDFHYYTTLIKYGIGRATYDAAQEIRSRDITREEGIALVRRYDQEFPERFTNDIFRYLSINEKEFPVAYRMFEQPTMDKTYFNKLVDKFRSPHIWKYENGQWSLRHAVWESITEMSVS